MGQFLNNKEPYDKYKTVMNGTFFVDKTEILKELIPALQQEQRFFCITRPRRFGKTVMANMIAAFFEKNSEKSLFEKQITELKTLHTNHWKEVHKCVKSETSFSLNGKIAKCAVVGFWILYAYFCLTLGGLIIYMKFF